VLLAFGAPCELRSLAGQEHGRTIPLADILPLARDMYALAAFRSLGQSACLGMTFGLILFDGSYRREAQMRRRRLVFLILTFVGFFALPLAMSGPASAVINNGGGVKGPTCEDWGGLDICLQWCATTFSGGSHKNKRCGKRCWTNWCGTPYPTTAGKPVKGTGTAPVVNGKPVQAPPPPKGSNPTGSAPTAPSQPVILERSGGSGGGGGGRR